MRCRTPHVLDSASSLVSIPKNTSVILSTILAMNNFQEDQPTKWTKKESGAQLHFRHSCRLSNWCWRGASRLANGQGVNCTPGVRRGAGQPVVQADLRRLQSDASVRLISCSAA